MISLTKCKKKLNKNGVKYTDEEILMIRNVLYKFAEVFHNHIQKTSVQNDLNTINNEKNPK